MNSAAVFKANTNKTVSDPVLEKALTLASNPERPILPITGRVAYVVSHGISYASNGYAIRTQGIARALNQNGLEAICFVRPGRPWGLPGVPGRYPNEQRVEGVRYIHTPLPSDIHPDDPIAHLAASVDRMLEWFQVYRPAAVLAASNWQVGLPAWIAAQRLGIPFNHEVRGFWELSRAAREPSYGKTAEFRIDKQRDTFVAQQANRVFTLNSSMKAELGRRGVDESRIDIVPNGVAELPEIRSANPALRQKLGIGADDKVIGYIGSFTAYEGIDLLIEACEKLAKRGENIKLLLIGDEQPITQAAGVKQSGAAQPWLIQIGRIRHDQVGDYYALIDTIVIPRRKLQVCELVPPIKAAEALAYGKHLIVSDVAPLAEYAQQHPGVMVFQAGKVDGLVQALKNNQRISANDVRESLLFSEQASPMRNALSTQRRGKTPPKPTMLSAVSIPPNSIQKITPGGTLHQAETVALPQKTPLWHSIRVESGQSLVISAACEYLNIKGTRTRKAVLLLKSFDQHGHEIDKPCGRISKSGTLKAYFKYLPCTQNQIQELHSFSVPEGVSEIHVGVCLFNAQPDEQVLLRELRVQPKPEQPQPAQFVPPSAQAAEISILGWPEHPPNGKPYVIGIMDEFTTGCFEQDVNLIQPRPDNWYALAEKYRPEFFFIESAWQGNYGSWQYRVADYANKPGQEIAHICQYAREKGVPTVFWNKEDPVHHQKFMCSAKLADHIFTTDANMKASYQAKTGNPRVHALPFAAQPALHKPAPLAGRKPRACFAGSWYGNRHAERGEAMRWLLQAANPYGLDIYDRNHGTGMFPFPDEYQAGIKGSLPYKVLCQEYRRYRVFLNVNSVTQSPTMFARRVFELMACGTPVVSTYAKGIENLFDSDAVWLVHSQEDADEALHTLMTDDGEWRRRSLAGIREVFAKHTYAHRLNDIFDLLGIETRLPTDPSIVVVAEAHSRAELEAWHQFALKQSYHAFQLGIACAPGFAQLADSLSDNITLLQKGQEANWLIEQHANTPLAGWLSPHAHYGEHYLRDLACASLYEPAASGWAKALEQDRFAYGGQARLSGAVFKRLEFLKQPINAHPDERITRPDLYLADSDQFQPFGAAQQPMGG